MRGVEIERFEKEYISGEGREVGGKERLGKSVHGEERREKEPVSGESGGEYTATGEDSGPM